MVHVSMGAVLVMMLELVSDNENVGRGLKAEIKKSAVTYTHKKEA